LWPPPSRNLRERSEMDRRHERNTTFPHRDLRKDRSRLRLRFLAVGAALLLLLVTGATDAGAAIFSPGESIGTFKVLGGHFDQQVNYLADYELTSGNGCYVYKFSDQGGSNYALTFDKG